MYIFAFVRIYRNQKFSLYIKSLDHPPPHCHVRFKDGSQICVTIPFIEPMHGAIIDKEVKNAILENLDALSDAWDLLHPIPY